MKYIYTTIIAIVLSAVAVYSQVIEVRKTGWYSVSFAQLSSAGFDVNSNPSTWRLYHDDVQVPIKITGNSIEFFGKVTPNKYTDRSGYILKSETTTFANRVIADTVRVRGNPSSTFSYTQSEEYDINYFPSGLNGNDRDNWYGYFNYPEGASFTIDLPQCESGAGTIYFDISKYVTASPEAYLEIRLNGLSLGQFTQSATVPVSNLQTGNNTIELFSNPTVLGYYFVNATSVTCDRSSVQTGENFEISLDRGKVLFAPFARVFELGSDGSIIEFSEPYIDKKGNKTADYLISTETLVPDVVRPFNSYSSGAGNLVIITPNEFMPTAQALKTLKEADRTVKIVTTEQIYDTYGSGIKSPYAITRALQQERNFGAEYVIYLGDASYDPKNILGLGKDYVPTHFYESTLKESASDSMLSDFDGDGVEELYSGRLPINSNAEGQILVDKIARFQAQPVRDKSALIIGDTYFEITVDDYANSLPLGISSTVLKKIDYTNAELRQAIIDNWNLSPYFIHYVGHGSTIAWNQFFSRGDITSLANTDLSFVYAGSCNTGYFTQPNTKSLAESMAFGTNGAIVYMGATQTIWASDAIALGREVNFNMYDSQYQTVGQAFKYAKLVNLSDSFKPVFVLFGDPTLELK